MNVKFSYDETKKIATITMMDVPDDLIGALPCLFAAAAIKFSHMKGQSDGAIAEAKKLLDVAHMESFDLEQGG